MKLLPSVLAAAALVAMPSAASAATTLTGCPQPEISESCTFIQESRPLPAGKTITGWGGTFAAGSMVRLYVMRDNGDGTFTPTESAASQYPEGGAETWTTEVPVPADGGRYVLGMDLYDGQVAVADDPAGKLRVSDELIWFGSTGTGPVTPRTMLVDVTLADPEPVATPTPDPTVDPGPGPGPGPDPGPGEEPASGFKIEPRSVLELDGKTVGAYTRNDLGRMIDGTIRLKVGKTTFKPARISEYDYHSSEDFQLPIAGKARKKLLRKGALRGTVIAKTSAGTFKQNVKVLRGGAARYDGEYRGPGPLIIIVRNGTIHTVNQSLNLFCPRSNIHMTRTMSAVPGFPVLVKKNGSFSGRATESTDTYHYKGRFSKNGTVKGYLSLFHANIGLTSGGSITSEDCYQASNFTAKRS